MKRKYPPVVKDMVFDEDLKRFRYVYFTDTELEQVLERECGDRWQEEPWAKVWLYRSAYRPVRYRKRVKRKREVVLPADILCDLVTFYKQQGYSKRGVYKVLRQKHYVTSGYKAIVDQVYNA